MTVPTPATDEPLPFSQQLRASTTELHERAHHSTYMADLLGGRLSLSGYTALATQYWFVYGALEEVGDALADDPVVGAFVVDGLRRRPGLACDLERLLGAGWQRRLAPLPATERYTARLRELTDWPAGWVAHHYTRYLGDLAGGQVVRALLRRTYDITGPGALFYDFDALGSVPAFRRHYRGLLDGVPWDARERARVAAETRRAFELNIDVLDELADVVAPEPRSA